MVWSSLQNRLALAAEAAPVEAPAVTMEGADRAAAEAAPAGALVSAVPEEVAALVVAPAEAMVNPTVSSKWSGTSARVSRAQAAPDLEAAVVRPFVRTLRRGFRNLNFRPSTSLPRRFMPGPRTGRSWANRRHSGPTPRSPTST